MKCARCSAQVETTDISCGQCGKSLAKTRDELQRVDPKSTAAIGWALFAIGVIAMVFVIANFEVLVLSGLDFVVPIGLLVAGTGTVAYARKLKR